MSGTKLSMVLYQVRAKRDVIVEISILKTTQKPFKLERSKNVGEDVGGGAWRRGEFGQENNKGSLNTVLFGHLLQSDPFFSPQML